MYVCLCVGLSVEEGGGKPSQYKNHKDKTSPKTNHYINTGNDSHLQMMGGRKENM